MGKDEAIIAHYKEICSLLEAWINEEEESELKETISWVKPLIKVLEWSYVDEHDFSLTEEATRRKNQHKQNRRWKGNDNNNYADEEGVENEEEIPLEGEEGFAELNTAPKSENSEQDDGDAPEELGVSEMEHEKKEVVQEKVTTAEAVPVAESVNASAPAEEKEKPQEGEKAAEGAQEEREERDDTIYLDDDLFHKLGYGIKSIITLSSRNEAKVATLHLHYSCYNWDIKEYDKPDFSLFSFSNRFTLNWEPTPSSSSSSSSTNSTTSTSSTTESTTATTETNTTTTEAPKSETTSSSEEAKLNLLPLLSGCVDGDKRNFSTHIQMNGDNLTELRKYLQYDQKDDIFFSEANFVVLLYFVTVCMSIEDQPFNELPALISSKVRRFFLKQILYELGANVGQYKYIIENLSYAMEEIKEQASQDRYSFRGTSSSRIVFGDDDEAQPAAKRTLDGDNSDQGAKKLKQ